MLDVSTWFTKMPDGQKTRVVTYVTAKVDKPLYILNHLQGESWDVIFYLLFSYSFNLNWNWKTFPLSVPAKFTKATKPGDQKPYIWLWLQSRPKRVDTTYNDLFFQEVFIFVEGTR